MIYVVVPHFRHVRHLTDVIVDAIEEKGWCHEPHVCKSFKKPFGYTMICRR